MSTEIEDTLTPGLDKFIKDFDIVSERAAIKTGLQLLNNCNNGSPQEPVVPPKLTGALRGSASVFVNGRLVGIAPNIGGKPIPAKSITEALKEDNLIISIVYNTAYARRLHEEEWRPGIGSSNAGSVGNKWVEKHINADGEELLEFHGTILKKDLFKS